MSAGRFAGRILHAEVEGIELYEEQMNLRVEQEFHAPPGALVFSFDMSENTLYLLDGETRNAWVTPENYREVAVVIKQDARWGQSGDAFADLVLTPLRSDNCRSVAASLSNMLTGASGGHHSMDAPVWRKPSSPTASRCFAKRRWATSAARAPACRPSAWCSGSRKW